MEDGAFWASKTSGYLRAFFYGAAYARSQGANFGLADVARWALSDRSEQAEDILKDAGAGHWSEEVRQLRGEARKTSETIRMYLSQALQFMADPALAAAVSPRPGEPPFDLHGFATSQDTLYMIAQGQDEHSPMAGLFACLASEIHYAAGMVGSFTGTGRLPRPMLLALDEVCQLCPVPLASWMADSGGKGIQVVAVGHGEAQFRAKFGRHSARQIFDCAGLLAVLPGVTDPETLKTVSQACGSIQMRHYGSENYTSVPVMDEAMVRQLPRGRALLLRNNLSPVIIRAGRVWDDPLYKLLRREPQPQPPRAPLAIVPGEVVGPDDLKRGSMSTPDPGLKSALLKVSEMAERLALAEATMGGLIDGVSDVRELVEEHQKLLEKTSKIIAKLMPPDKPTAPARCRPMSSSRPFTGGRPAPTAATRP